MTRLPVVLRELAWEDVGRAFDRYLEAAGPDIAVSFSEAVEAALSHIAEHPASGSTRYAVEFHIPGLRHWPTARFPFLILYAQVGERVDVWRVIHGQRDIAAWLRPQGPGTPGTNEVREQLADYRVSASEAHLLAC